MPSYFPAGLDLVKGLVSPVLLSGLPSKLHVVQARASLMA